MCKYPNVALTYFMISCMLKEFTKLFCVHKHYRLALLQFFLLPFLILLPLLTSPLSPPVPPTLPSLFPIPSSPPLTSHSFPLSSPPPPLLPPLLSPPSPLLPPLLSLIPLLHLNPGYRFHEWWQFEGGSSQRWRSLQWAAIHGEPPTVILLEEETTEQVAGLFQQC